MSRRFDRGGGSAFLVIRFCALCAGLAGVTPIVSAQPLSDGVFVPSSSLNGGGAVDLEPAVPLSSLGRVGVSIGQPSPLGTSRDDDTGIAVAAGFWPAVVKPGLSICPGDCSESGVVTIDELVTGVNIALDELPLDACPSIDGDDNGTVTIDELIDAVNNALLGC